MVILNTFHTPRGTWHVEAHQQGTSYWYSVSRDGSLLADKLTITAAMDTIERLSRAEEELESAVEAAFEKSSPVLA